MDFKNKIVIVTGGAQGIGRCIAEEFGKRGATVCVIDKQQGDHFVGDLADKQVLEQFAKDVIEKHGHVDYLVTEGRFFRYNKRTVPLLSSLHHRYACQGGSI